MILWRVAPWPIYFIFVNIITLITWFFRQIVVHCDWNWPMETEKPKSSLEIVKSFHRSHHVVISIEFPHYNTNFSLNPANSQTWALKHRLVCVFKNWKLLFKNIYGNTCGWKSALKYVKCCLKTENCCLKI